MSLQQPEAIPLRSQRATWLFLSLTVGLTGLGALGLGAGGLLAAGFGVAERLVFGAGGTIAGVLLLLGARLAIGVALAHPQVLVDASAFRLEHPGLLREPLVVHRSDIAEVVVDESSDPARGLAVNASSELLPDFSTPIGSSARHPNVLVILQGGLGLDGIPRRGASAVAFIADRFSSYCGPPRGGVINGLLFEAERPGDVRRAFEPWGVLVQAPSDSALARIGPSQFRQRSRKR